MKNLIVHIYFIFLKTNTSVFKQGLIVQFWMAWNYELTDPPASMASKACTTVPILRPRLKFVYFYVYECLLECMYV